MRRGGDRSRCKDLSGRLWSTRVVVRVVVVKWAEASLVLLKKGQAFGKRPYNFGHGAAQIVGLFVWIIRKDEATDGER